MHCQFCENPVVQDRMIVSNELVIVFPGNMPIVPGHLLVCPKRCVAKINDLSDQEVLALKEMVVAMQNALKQAFGAEGFNCAWNEGDPAGQSVPHLHIHVLPRKVGDTGILQYEPRQFLYRPGSREVSPEYELVEVARMVRSSFHTS